MAVVAAIRPLRDTQRFACLIATRPLDLATYYLRACGTSSANFFDVLSCDYRSDFEVLKPLHDPLAR
jgi:hypothetical protein